MFVSLACVTGAAARDLTATPASLRQQVAALHPGDNLALQPGKYPGGVWLKGLYGRPDAPITIRGQGPQTVLLGREGTNTVDLSDCRWLVLRDLTFDGQGKAVDAIKAGKETALGCHHITIETTRSSTTGPISRSWAFPPMSPCSDWTIRGNTILGAGTEIIVAPVPQLGKLERAAPPADSRNGAGGDSRPVTEGCQLRSRFLGQSPQPIGSGCALPALVPAATDQGPAAIREGSGREEVPSRPPGETPPVPS